MSTALIPYTPTSAVDRALDWAALPADARKRRAALAASAHDGAALAALADAYLTLHGGSGARVSAHTRRAYATGIAALVAAWRQENLLHPARDAGPAWLRRLEDQGATPATVRVRLAAARALYRALRWAGATSADPFTDARPGPDRTPAWEKRQPYSEADLDRLLALAGPEDRLLLLLGAHAGLRAAEIRATRGADIDLATGTITVRAGKGNKRRRVAASASLRRALAACDRPDPDGPLLDLTEQGYRKRLARLCASAGVPYRGLHALRHYAGTRVVREGGTLEDAARHLGHATIETARIYAKWADERLRTQVAAW